MALNFPLTVLSNNRSWMISFHSVTLFSEVKDEGYDPQGKLSANYVMVSLLLKSVSTSRINRLINSSKQRPQYLPHYSPTRPTSNIHCIHTLTWEYQVGRIILVDAQIGSHVPVPIKKKMQSIGKGDNTPLHPHVIAPTRLLHHTQLNHPNARHFSP